jgi:hypothetical protein
VWFTVASIDDTVFECVCTVVLPVVGRQNQMLLFYVHILA